MAVVPIIAHSSLRLDTHACCLTACICGCLHIFCRCFMVCSPSHVKHGTRCTAPCTGGALGSFQATCECNCCVHVLAYVSISVQSSCMHRWFCSKSWQLFSEPCVGAGCYDSATATRCLSQQAAGVVLCKAGAAPGNTGKQQAGSCVLHHPADIQGDISS
jgi:hypothetical protein